MIRIDYNFDGGVIGALFALVLCVMLIVSLWKIFVKAGKPGCSMI